MKKTTIVDVHDPATPADVPLPWDAQDEVKFAALQTQLSPPKRRHATAVPVQPWRGSSPDHYYPGVYVRVPRAVCDRWWPQPWADVLAAAEGGVDGLSVRAERPLPWQARACDGLPRDPDCAFLAEGQDSWRGKTVLFQQNW